MSHNKTPEDPKQQKQRWFPLESNPELMNEYVENLGFDTSLYHFVDVFATEEWALSMIPQPVAAVLFLYPLTEAQRNHETGNPVTTTNYDNEDDKNSNQLWFIRQRIGNACGTIGLLHALLNAAPPDPALVGQNYSWFRHGSWLEQFQASCPRGMDPLQKAEILEADAQIAALHDQATSSSQNATSRGNLEDRIVTHFVALVCGSSSASSASTSSNDPPLLLYELDGRRAGPVPHGPTRPETLLRDACRVIQTNMQRDPTELRFSILALAPRVDYDTVD